MADKTYNWNGTYGLDWGTPTYNNFGPYDTTPQPGQPWQADWTNTSTFIDGDWNFDTSSKCDFSSEGLTPAGDWPAYSEVWRMYFAGAGDDPIDQANIPLGSYITKISFGAKWTFYKGYRARMRMSRDTSFNQSWVGDDDNNIISNVTGLGLGQGRSIGGEYGEGSGRWNNTQEEMWDFLAGDDNISGRVYVYFWFEHPDVDSHSLPVDPYNPYWIEIKRLRIYSVNWREPSTGSGILLGNI